MYADYEIREVPIGYGPARRKVEEFLGKRTLRLDKVDYYEAIYPCGGDEMLAVGLIATRTTTGLPFVSPPTIPPAWRAWRTSTWPTAWCPI